MSRMHNYDILYIVHKATSELDFGVPLLWKIRKENPEAKIAVLYCTINKRRILRQSVFYSKFFSENHIEEYDFSDFLIVCCRPYTSFMKRRCSGSYWDTQYLDNYKQKRLSYGLLRRIVSRNYERILYRLVSFSDLFSYFSPKVVFLALRGYAFPRKEEFIDYTYRISAKVVLYPHGAFCSNGREELFYSKKARSKEKPLPDFCEYWYPCIKEETVDSYPLMKKQMFYVGYPGLDSEWLVHLWDRDGKEKVSGDAIRCVLIVRKSQKNAQDYGVLEYDEFIEMLNAVLSALRETGKHIKVIIKPHPSNDFIGLSNMMEASGYPDWEISYEPNYLEITRCDFVIAVPSTSILVPLMYGLPVIVLNCSVKKQFDEAWWFMKELFAGFDYFVEDLSDFDAVLGRALTAVAGNRKDIKSNTKEIEYFRRYYPDNSLRLCTERIRATTA